MCSSAPDTSGMNAAAVSQANLSAEQLAWAKDIYAQTAPDRAAATARANQISDAQLEAMNTQTGLAKDYADYNKGTFQPLEKSIVADAQNYDTPDRVAANVGRAEADVNAGFSNAREQQTRSLARMGVNPSSGRALALGNQTAIAQAASLADASNKARLDTETVGRAMKMDAAGLGRNLPSNQATTAGLAVNAGNASLASGLAPLNVNASGNQIMTSGFGGAAAGLGSAANIYGSIAGVENSTNSSNNAVIGGLGTAAGMIFSDKHAKKNIKPVSSKASLAAFKKMPVSNWNYKKGLGDGGNHTGPMAQDVRKGLGDSVAPGGKVIDPISLHGHQINAIKELDKRLSKVEKRA
jgi:hypothetical protein